MIEIEQASTNFEVGLGLLCAIIIIIIIIIVMIVVVMVIIIVQGEPLV